MYPGTYAARTPDRIAAVMTGSGETLSYGDLERRSVQLAHEAGKLMKSQLKAMYAHG